MASSADLYPSFVARDEDGRRHVLRVLPGPPRVVLEGGGDVERAGKGRYVTPWGEVLVSDDPEAP
jgi:hypothetical protein